MGMLAAQLTLTLSLATFLEEARKQLSIIF